MHKKNGCGKQSNKVAIYCFVYREIIVSFRFELVYKHEREPFKFSEELEAK